MKRAIVIAGPKHLPEKHQQSIDWLVARVNHVGEWNADKSLTVTHVLYDEETREAEILCVVALNNWTQHTCEGHIASDGTKRWATREFFFTVYDLAFRECNRTRMTFLVEPGNESAVRMHDKFSHKREGLLEDAMGEGKDLILYGLTRKQWINGRFAKPHGERK